MPIETLWLEEKGAVPGLDQLGVRATAIRMYAHLVPGITNVTDRARYFTIHPYVIDHWAREIHTDDKIEFQKLLRRVECLLALGEKARVYGTDEDSYGVVGTVRLTRWLRDQPDPGQKDYPVPIRKLADEYFGNRWGSLGQYYGGPELGFGLIAWDDGLPRITPLGQQLAAAFSTAAKRSGLPELLRDNSPRISKLKKMGQIVGFDKLSPKETQLLREIILDLNARYGDDGIRRRNTCLLLLSLAKQAKDPIGYPTWAILDAALHGRCGEETHYVCPPFLSEHLCLWKTYAFQEFLAFGLEVLLAVAVEVLQELEISRESAPQSARELAQGTAALLSQNFGRQKVSALVGESVRRLQEPSLHSKLDPWEEGTLRASANKALRAGRLSEALQYGVKLVARLFARLSASTEPYDGFTKSKLDIDYQRFGLANIQRFMNRARDSSVASSVSELVTEIINIHLRVATAKLAYNNDFTYKLVFDNGRLRKVRTVEPAISSPRLQQTAQILADIGFLVRKNRSFQITQEGVDLLNRFGG